MAPNKKPQNNPSLKESCLATIEAMILSGQLPMGEKLPAERDLAAQLGVGRPLVHEALVELSMKGLVTISPRHGVKVNDFHDHGSILLLNSLLNFDNFKLDESVWQGMFDFRRLIEGETSRLAAVNRTDSDLLILKNLLLEEETLDRSDPHLLMESDFKYHLTIARVSGNLIYPLLLNSFKDAYTSYTHAFFKNNLNTSIIHEVFDFHKDLIQAITDSSPDRSRQIMTAMLDHGQMYWKG